MAEDLDLVIDPRDQESNRVDGEGRPVTDPLTVTLSRSAWHAARNQLLNQAETWDRTAPAFAERVRQIARSIEAQALNTWTDPEPGRPAVAGYQRDKHPDWYLALIQATLVSPAYPFGSDVIKMATGLAWVESVRDAHEGQRFWIKSLEFREGRVTLECGWAEIHPVDAETLQYRQENPEWMHE